MSVLTLPLSSLQGEDLMYVQLTSQAMFPPNQKGTLAILVILEGTTLQMMMRGGVRVQSRRATACVHEAA